MHVIDLCELIHEQIKKINKLNNEIFNVGGGLKNAISLNQLSKRCEKITKNKIKIGKKKSTSNYDIPYYVTDNSKIYKFYNWRVKRNLEEIIKDVYKILKQNQKIFKKI